MASYQSIHKTKKKKKRKKRPPKQFYIGRFFSALFSVFLLIGITGFLVWYFSFENICVSEILNLSYSGYNKKGTVSLSFPEDSEYSSFFQDSDLVLLSENGNLRNGDVLEIQLVYDKETARSHNLRIKEDTCRITVEGLPKGRKLSLEDLFQGMEITYDGIAPALKASVANTSSEPFFQSICYRIADPKDFYDLGDVLLIKAEISEESEEEAIENQYILPSSEDAYLYEVSIENVSRYLREPSELSDIHLETLNETASSLFKEADEYGLRIFSEANLMPIWVNGKTTFRWSNPRLLSVYLSCLKPEYFGSSQSHNNDVKLVYNAVLSQADGVACDAEVVVQFNDLIQNADGSYDLALSSGQIIAASFRDSHIKDLVTASYNKEYESEKLLYP